MGTRSFIAIKDNDTIKGVYCHWDGYPEGVGAVLNEHYNDAERAKELISKGDMSSLAPTLDASVFYTSRGEPLKVSTLVSEEQLTIKAKGCGSEYLYLFKDNKWECTSLYC